MGGRRLVRVRQAGDGVTAAVRLLLEVGEPAALVVLEAGELAGGSSLRRAVEAAPQAMALPCFRDEGRDLGATVRAALALPESELPQPEPPSKVPRGLGPVIELLRVLLKLKCEEHHVAQRLVATAGDLEAIATQSRPDVAALKGWRLEVFGRAALALKRGELALAIADGQIVLVPAAGLLGPA